MFDLCFEQDHTKWLLLGLTVFKALILMKSLGKFCWNVFVAQTDRCHHASLCWLDIIYVRVSQYLRVCATCQASHHTAPPPAVRSLLTVQSLPGQWESGKTTWNNLTTVSVRERQETERDYLTSFTACHAIGGFPLRLKGTTKAQSAEFTSI